MEPLVCGNLLSARSRTIYTADDFENFAQILVDTSALKQNNNAIEVVPKSSRGWKWAKILSKIWANRRNYEGQGIVPTVVIPADPHALADRLELLSASKAACNIGVRNELVSVHVTNY